VRDRKLSAVVTLDGDGSGPLSGGLIQDAAGNLYGATGAGGYRGNGVVFEITP